MTTTPFILDIGSYSCKVGYSGTKAPETFLSIVGSPSRSIKNDMNLSSSKRVVVGDKLRAGIHDLSYPIQNGEISNWDDVQILFEHAFKRAQLDDSDEDELSVILTDSIYSLDSSRQKLAEIMFETHQASYFYIDYQPFFSLLAKREKSAGIVVEIGDGITQIYPCIGGYPLRKGMSKIPHAGRDITTDLANDFLNTEIGGKSHLKDVARIKEQYCRVALDYEQELQNLTEVEFVHKNLELAIGEGQIRAPEMLFKLGGVYEQGLHELINESILNCDSQYHAYLYQNIILSGGTAAFPGFAERLEQEMKAIAPDQTIRVSALANPSEAAWRGASKFSRYPQAFHKRFAINRLEYKEDEHVVAQKCFTFKS